MTPKEKAEELVQKFLPIVRGADRYNYNIEDMNVFISKQCANITVDEILNGYRKLLPSSRKYWEEVKTQIESL